MKIEEMFVKPVDRDIKGVIKVEQNEDADVFQELDEYVVTKELTSHFRTFFDAYAKSIHGNVNSMGVWIKGFYGSGKSHFLKILSYLLENRSINGKQAISFFTDGKKINDGFISANIQLAGDTSTDVILFNIDSRSNIDAKSKKDAILSVFIRVFNEYLGYCGTNFYLADLERKLDEEEKYDEFQAVFQEISETNWKDSRDYFYFILDDVVETLSRIGYMTESAARTFCEKAIQDYELSINDFASRIRDYCKSKGPNHHVVFLADEVGQYIGDDSGMMLNLQTLTEDLGTKCKGKAWVIVTSQQEIGEITKVKPEDFSKITGRFETRISLSSSNVGEVIRIRLLSKTDTATQHLRLRYQEVEPVLKNLLVFSDGTAEMKLYQNADDFAAVYPFVPYQFELLGHVLTEIRKHGSAGKHLSEGERSMLALFRDAAISVKDDNTGVLVSFDQFYQALHSFLDHSHAGVILRATENEKLKPFDIKVLKTLFMIKYVKEIQANIENLTTLLIDSVETDRISLQQMISDSLKRLISETLVQKSGSVYIFLTNEEQEINHAIEKEEVQSGEITQKISEIVFEEILASLKNATDEGKRYSFAFNRYVDEVMVKAGQKAPLSLCLITPNNFDDWNDVTLRNSSYTEPKVMVALQGDGAYIPEIRNILRIRKYLTKQGTTGSANPAILDAKNREIKEAEVRIQESLRDALRYADIYVAGDKLDEGFAEKPETRIQSALTKLVTATYLKLSYLERTPKPAELKMVLTSGRQVTLDNNRENQKALDEVFRRLKDESLRNSHVTLKNLQDIFEGIPYGYSKTDVAWLVTALFADNRVTLKIHGTVLNRVTTPDTEIEHHLLKNADQLLIEERASVPQAHIRGVKTILQNVFGIVVSAESEDALIDSLLQKIREEKKDIGRLLQNYIRQSHYPGKLVLDGYIEYLESIENAGVQFAIFKQANEVKDDLLDSYDDVNAVRGFFGGEQCRIFDSALEALDKCEDAGNLYTFDDSAKSAIENIKSIVEMQSPYKSIADLYEEVEKFNISYNAGLQQKKDEVRKTVAEDEGIVSQSIKESGIPESEFSQSPASQFQKLYRTLDSSVSFRVVTSIGTESDTITAKLLEFIDIWVQKKKTESAQRYDRQGAETPGNWGGASEKKTIHVQFSSLKDGAKLRLESEEDIEDFVTTIRYKLRKELEKGDSIQLR